MNVSRRQLVHELVKNYADKADRCAVRLVAQVDSCWCQVQAPDGELASALFRLQSALIHDELMTARLRKRISHRRILLVSMLVFWTFCLFDVQSNQRVRSPFRFRPWHHHLLALKQNQSLKRQMSPTGENR